MEDNNIVFKDKDNNFWKVSNMEFIARDPQSGEIKWSFPIKPASLDSLGYPYFEGSYQDEVVNRNNYIKPYQLSR